MRVGFLYIEVTLFVFFFSSRRRHTRWPRDWSSDVCSSDLPEPARDHLELGEGLAAIDVKRGTKVSGARFYFLTGVGARLELALLNAAMDKALANGFTPMITPTLVSPQVMRSEERRVGRESGYGTRRGR